MVTNYILLPIVSVLLFIFALLDGGALSVGRNWKEVRRVLLIFMISLIVGGIISSIGTSNIDFLFIATLPVSYVFFFLQGVAFLEKSMDGGDSCRRRCREDSVREQELFC